MRPVVFVVHPPPLDAPPTEIEPQEIFPDASVWSAWPPVQETTVPSASVLLNLPVPPKYALPVVVAPPKIVRPLAWPPAPMVDDELERKPEANVLSPLNHEAPETERSVEEALLKMLLPLNVLLLVRRVVEETMMDEPAVKGLPLMVPSVPVR